MADEFGFQLLWGAPYCPKFAVIERVWGFTKNAVAWLYRPGRNILETAVDVYMTWYGGTDQKSGDEIDILQSAAVAKMHASCVKDMNEYIDKHGQAMGLSGTIGNLTDTAIDLTGHGDQFNEIEEHDDDDDDDDEQVVLEEDG